ncbi:MAG TPA: ATP-binding protein [Aggregatilinea sp.]|uniref:sensor histidine kinase n=1 Tax=Aggregatilinea sp. TaxID=2806333 RepID=UPI002D14E3B8|nr:ATP-binding protein [Aggregatilinea sp.]HML22891.1 ATP-binding protein [Aggregatilinea sp.]
MRKLVRFWRRRVPIRIRLALWYLLSFTLLLLAFSAVFENHVEVGLRHQADTALRLVANRTAANVVQGESGLAFNDIDALDDVADEFSVVLLAPDQSTILAQFGIERSPLPPPPNEQRYFTVRSRGDPWRDEHNTWRVYNHPILAADDTVIGWLQIAQRYDPDQVLALVRGHLCLLAPAGFLLAALGGVFFASRALRPIDQVTQTARSIDATDLHQRLNYEGPNDEVGRLAKTFDGMLARLQAGFERERRFTGDAAHELRTPLTALKGHIDVTLSQPRKPGEYVETLQNLEQQVDRLIRLSSDLLFMARLDYDRQRRDTEAVVLNDLLAVLEDQLLPLAEARRLTLSSHVEPDLSVQGSMDLLIRLFLNLLDNAIKYTPHGGTITVRAGRSAGGIEVAIGDTGPGISPDQIPHLFERFYRVETDRARRAAQGADKGGAGLGQAIAQEIAHLHGGTITVASEIGQGSVFTVHFPAK